MDEPTRRHGPMAAPGELASLDSATEWLNAEPLTAAGLAGNVVLASFWTYTCINWLRTQPYLRAWSERYADQGLVVVGVHSPEFGFEHDLDNVRRAAAALHVDYPVVIDNGFRIWRAFGNHYWPALYFVDAQGRVRYHHFGEGDYQRSEAHIRELLAETGQVAGADGFAQVDARGLEAQADWESLQSPETYLGLDRTERFASPGGAAADTRRGYVAPAVMGLNQWALSGEWTMGPESARLEEADGRILYRFSARDLNLVMGPEARGTSVPFQVRVDGQPPGAAHGVDVDVDGNGTLSDQRLYQLVRQPGPVTEHTFEINFRTGGAQAFVFTFG